MWAVLFSHGCCARPPRIRPGMNSVDLFMAQGIYSFKYLAEYLFDLLFDVFTPLKLSAFTVII
jgi:hypothetical protein